MIIERYRMVIGKDTLVPYCDRKISMSISGNVAMIRNLAIKRTLALKKAKLSIKRLIDGLFISVLLRIFFITASIYIGILSKSWAV